LILGTSGLGLIVEGKMIAARHDGGEAMEFTNPLDSGHIEDHADEAEDMMELADSMR
jgi:hypothetical protein